MPISNSPKAIQVIRKLHSGSQPFLLRCDDGKAYVVKFNNNPQGGNLLANEVFGSELLKAVGLPTPTWKPIYVDQELLDRNRQLQFILRSDVRVIGPGVYFGSEFMGEEHVGNLYHRMPAEFQDRLINPLDIFGMYLFDVWMNHCDSRQSLYVTRDKSQSFVRMFIDNGELLGGARWESICCPGAYHGRERCFFSQFRRHPEAEEWIRRFEQCAGEVLSRIPLLIPETWYVGRIDVAVSSIRDRLSNLRELLDEDHARLMQVSSTQAWIGAGHNVPIYPLKQSYFGDGRKRPSSSRGIHFKG